MVMAFDVARFDRYKGAASIQRNFAFKLVAAWLADAEADAGAGWGRAVAPHPEINATFSPSPSTVAPGPSSGQVQRAREWRVTFDRLFSAGKSQGRFFVSLLPI